MNLLTKRWYVVFHRWSGTETRYFAPSAEEAARRWGYKRTYFSEVTVTVESTGEKLTFNTKDL